MSSWDWRPWRSSGAGAYPVNGLTTELIQPTALVVLAGCRSSIVGICIPWSRPGRPQHPQVFSEKWGIAIALTSLVFNAVYVLCVGPATFLESRLALDSAASMIAPNPVVRAIGENIAKGSAPGLIPGDPCGAAKPVRAAAVDARNSCGPHCRGCTFHGEPD